MMQEIRRDLVATVAELDFAIHQVKSEFPEDPYRAQYRDGRYILLEALAAKGQALAALANLCTPNPRIERF